MRKEVQFFLITSFFVLFIQSSCDNKSDKGKKGDFDFTVCNATYKGKPLPFEGTIDDWVKVFGRYDRCVDDFWYVWDKKGLFLWKTDFTKRNKVKSNERPVELYIMFVNLDSPIGQAGKLEYASEYESFEHIIKRNAEGGYIYSETGKKSLKEMVDKDSVTKYPYPLKTYTDTVLVDGGIIASGISLADVNRNRKAADNKGVFGYWDTDMDRKNERGSTKVKTGQFNDFGMEREMQKCAIENKYYFLTTLRYTEGVLEYIKVQKVEKGKSIYWY